MRIGVLSDTHGLLRPEVLAALEGVEHIFHAGDVGDPQILERLRRVAPVTAVGGNVDWGGACDFLPDTEMVDLGGVVFYLLHILSALDLKPHAAGVAAVISGHTHKADLSIREGVMYLNPGSVGPRRFQLPSTLAIMTLESGLLSAELVELTCE